MPRATVVLTLALASSILAAVPARAHVTPLPAFAPAGETTRIRLTGPNERSEPMTAFAVTVPGGLAIVHAHPVGSWEPTIRGSGAVWSGAGLAEGEQETFQVDLDVDEDTPPGLVELLAEQRYPGGSVVRWPVRLTVTPAAEGPSQHLALAAVMALLGALLVAAVAALVVRRRVRPLSES